MPIVKTKTKKPYWNGPCGEGWEGGVTQSMLGGYLVCKERFRIRYVEGLQPVQGFDKNLEYGQMWHVCEEALAKDKPFANPLAAYCKKLIKKYPTEGTAIRKWHDVCTIQFPFYVRYWEKHPDVRHRTPLLQEVAFDVPYELPSGRIVRLRGKWDIVDVIGKGKAAGICLQENKTKGEIDGQKIVKQLTFDLQTMTYLVALIEYIKQTQEHYDNGTKAVVPFPPYPILGVRYNVIRRPLSGGKGSIRPHKPTKKTPRGEQLPEYYQRLGTIIAEDVALGDDNTYFHRWKVEVSKQDVDKFKRECLDPILENLCDDYEWWKLCMNEGWNIFTDYLGRVDNFPAHIPRHFRLPYGIWNPLTDGRGSALDDYLATGSRIDLVTDNPLFPELQDA